MTSHALLIPTSSIQSVAWPAMPGINGALMLAVQYQLEKSQWWSSERLLDQQMKQLAHLLRHAGKMVPYYEQHFGTLGIRAESITSYEDFRKLPILKREDIQTAAKELHARQLPREHGRIIEHHTSGSTGRPIAALGTELTQFFWNVLTLREHLWHRRDLRGKLASIRTTVKDATSPGWGPATDIAYKTGPCVMLNIRHDINYQLEWLQKENPEYILSHPSNLLAMAHLSLAAGVRLPNLKGIRTFGEPVTSEIRAACKEAWGVSVTDTYSSEELGYIALQCPEHEHYHIQSESVLVEILNDNDQPCEPGEIGRVVITTLHNFAMPLIRYEIMDYAEAGEPCPCGRGLPVIKRIMGRQRNLVTLPDGTRHWPSFPAESWAFIAPIRQIQLVQRDMDSIEARLVTDRTLDAKETAELIAVLQKHLGYPFQITFQYLEKIDRKTNFKYEDFISEISSNS